MTEHEPGPRELVASSWARFLRRLVRELESGAFMYVEADGSVELVEELERDLRKGEFQAPFLNVIFVSREP